MVMRTYLVNLGVSILFCLQRVLGYQALISPVSARGTRGPVPARAWPTSATVL